MSMNKLVIRIESGGKSRASSKDEKNAVPKKGAGKNSRLYKALHIKETLTAKFEQQVSPTTFFAVQRGVNLALQTARQSVSYVMSDIGRRNGDSNFQSIVNRRIEQVTDPLSVASGFLGGAVAGAALGPWGALIGATVGAASAGISLGFKYAGREREYQHEMFKENNSQAYNLARANYSALTGRVR